MIFEKYTFAIRINDDSGSAVDPCRIAPPAW